MSPVWVDAFKGLSPVRGWGVWVCTLPLAHVSNRTKGIPGQVVCPFPLPGWISNCTTHYHTTICFWHTQNMSLGAFLECATWDKGVRRFYPLTISRVEWRPWTQDAFFIGAILQTITTLLQHKVKETDKERHVRHAWVFRAMCILAHACILTIKFL